jgi:(heptosyl)LPS beta-1,4-glucosyltransferase
MKIAAVIITRDEENNIAACLESVQWADERIVVDAESRDRTVEIAKQHATQVHVRPWPGYGPQKNFGMEQARAEWILIVDADERITPALREEIQAVLKAGPSGEIAGFEIPRRNYFYGRWIRGGGIYPDYQLRLIRKAAGRYDDTQLHENLRLQGRIERLRQPMEHYSMPTVREQEKLKSRSRVTALDIVGHHLGTILKTYLLRGGYRDGVHGVIVALFAGMHTFVKYAKAWELLKVRGSRFDVRG